MISDMLVLVNVGQFVMLFVIAMYLKILTDPPKTDVNAGDVHD